VSAILTLLIVAAATIILTSNLALADWKPSFQQKPQIAIQSAFPSGTAAIMAFNKIGSGSSSSSIYASSSTAKDPYEHISSNNINPLQPFGTIRDGSPLTSRTSTNNIDASAYTTTTRGNTGSTPTTRMIQSMTTSETSHAQRQQQNPTSPEAVTPLRPSQVTMVTLSLGGQITCKSTELLRNSKCIPQPPTCVPIGISQDSKCSTRPLYYHHMLMSIRSFWHR
jgi:hypothetical protein